VARPEHQVVRTPDGAQLAVWDLPADRPEAPVVVLPHCWGCSHEIWIPVARRLREQGYRVVLYDQRGHGQSTRGTAPLALETLALDLEAVVEATDAHDVVFAGHSMGGMTIMALAEQHPELFGPRIVAVALLSTSTGKLAEAAFGLPSAVVPVTSRVVPFLTRGMRSRPQVFERGRRLGTDLAFLISRSWAFGSRDVSPALVEFVERMTANTPVEVIAEFYDTFTDHDKLAALDVLDRVETLILVGSKDKLTPLSHSQVMAASLPSAQLVVVEGAGHMVQLERAPLLNLHLRALLRRAATSVARSA
jgi:pimeloyl-ACP methyl ester carboxylesterase